MAAPTVSLGPGSLAIWTTGAATACSLSGATVGHAVLLVSLVDGDENVVLSGHANIANLAGTASSITAIASGDVLDGSVARLCVHIGRATSSAPSVSVSTAGGADVYAIMWAFADVSAGTTLATVIENGTAGAYTGGTGTSTTIAGPSITTLDVDRRAVCCIGVNDDNQASFAATPFSGESGGSWVAQGAAGSSTGTDGAAGMQSAAMAAAGTISGGTITMASDTWGVVGFALIGTTVTTRVPRSPGVDSGNAHLCKAWHAARRWRYGAHGILVPEISFVH